MQFIADLGIPTALERIPFSLVILFKVLTMSILMLQN